MTSRCYAIVPTCESLFVPNVQIEASVARPADFASVFENAKKDYLGNCCNDNIFGLLKRLKAEGLDLSNAKVLYLYVRSSGGPHMDGADWIYPQSAKDPEIRRWKFRTVLFNNGLIYDFDFKSEAKPVEIRKWFKEMWRWESDWRLVERFGNDGSLGGKGFYKSIDALTYLQKYKSKLRRLRNPEGEFYARDWLVGVERPDAIEKPFRLFGKDPTFFESGLVLDSRYGTLNQYDEAFESRPWSPSDRTLLGGPICLFNVLVKLGVIVQRSGSVAEHRQEFARFMRELFVAGASRKQFQQTGMGIADIAIALQGILKNAGIPSAVALSSAIVRGPEVENRIDLNLLKKSVDDNVGLIVSVSAHSETDPMGAFLKNRMISQTLVVIGYDAKNSKRFYFSDPADGPGIRSAILSKVAPTDFLTETYRVRFEDSNDDGHGDILITGLVAVQPKR